jgi:mRNA interferase MazF
MRSAIYKTFDIVVVPFPFVDKTTTKNRPALIISSQKFNNDGNTVMMMITSALHTSWFLDAPITDLKKAGLSKPSKIRTKLFTIDNRLIKSKIGRLSKDDQHRISNSFNILFNDILSS